MQCSNLIAKLHGQHELTSLIATHNFEFARRCHRVLRLHEGHMEEVTPESLRQLGGSQTVA